MTIAILIHGFYGYPAQFNKIEDELKAEGYFVHNEKYKSTDDPIETIVENHLKPIFDKYQTAKKIDVITHSMGALLCRYYLAKYACENLGRVVMISPPNNGSDLTGLYVDNPFFNWLTVPVFKQLQPNSVFLKALPEVTYDVGVIAATKTHNPILSAFIKGEDDGFVSIDSMNLKNQKDFIEVDSSHLFVLSNKKTIQSIKKFLKTGLF